MDRESVPNCNPTMIIGGKLMKKNVIKMISILMALGMLCAVIPCGVMTYAEGTETVFADVAPDDWFYGDVGYVNEKGLMKGVAEATFAPDAPLSRAMCATILYRMAGEPDVSGVKTYFTDVPEGTWYTDAVKWAWKAEIVNGKTYTVFAPDDNIKRAEFATMLFRYAHYKLLGLPEKREYAAFADEKGIPDYAQTPISLLYCSEIINGKPGNKFAPNDNSTRAEAAAMLRRFSENTVSSDMWLLEKYGLTMTVSTTDNRQPTNDPSPRVGSYTVVFSSEAPDFNYSIIRVDAKVLNKGIDTELIKNSEQGSLYKMPYDAVVMLGLARAQKGERFWSVITVKIGEDVGTFYCYPQLTVIS